MQDNDFKINSISDSQLTPDGNRRLSLNEDRIQGTNQTDQNDENQKIKSTIDITHSRNGSDDITGKKRSKNSVQNEDESILSSPARKRQRIPKRNVQNSTNDDTSMDTTRMTREQLQQIQTEEQIAFQNQMIEEGIVPQPHVMQAIRQRQLMTQLTSNNNNNKHMNSKHENNHNDNNSNNTYNGKIGSRSTNRYMKNNKNGGGNNDPNNDNDSISDRAWHNDSNSNSSNSDDEVGKEVKNSKTSNPLQNLQDQNDILQKHLQESNDQINKLMSSISPGGGSNVNNNLNSMDIYTSMIKQQQLQIKQLMR